MDPNQYYYDPNQQQQQQQHQYLQQQHQDAAAAAAAAGMYDMSGSYGGGDSAAVYYPGGGAEQGGAYYPQQQQQQQQMMMQPEMAMYGDGGSGVGGDWSAMHQQQEYQLGAAPPPPVLEAEPGCYYPVDVVQMTGADPVTAVAYDDLHEAMFSASACASMSGARLRFNDHRASMLTTHSSASTMLYSSVAGHPEAPVGVLSAVYQAMYGSGIGDGPSNSSSSFSAPGSPTGSRRSGRPIPGHAYRPFYDDPTAAPTASFAGGAGSHQMGINSLVPVKGYVASVSPSAVRLHAHGGMQVADRHVEGMVCGAAHPSPGGGSDDDDMYLATHMTVGGLVLKDLEGEGAAAAPPNRHHLLCVDLWQGLRTVASCSLDRRGSTGNGVGSGVAVTALATNHSKGSIVAGCSDGQVRLFDGRLRNIGQIKSHAGGVVDVAVSRDGTLFATSGYGSRTARAPGSQLYGFPDPTVLVYDIRYLGRGGIPHPFAGLRGGPRFLAFVPDVEGKPSNRLLVASGQSGGGLHVMQTLSADGGPEDPSNFIVPQLDRDCITSMCVSEDNMALGTSQGTVLRYRLEGYSGSAADGASSIVNGGIFVPRSNSSANQMGGSHRSRGSGNSKKLQPLETPPFEPLAPALSIDASILRTEDPNTRSGMNQRIKSIFSSYILCREPTVSVIGDASNVAKTSFGHLAASPMVAPSRLRVSNNLLDKATQNAGDYLQTIPVSELDVDLLDDHRPDHIKSRTWRGKKPPEPNPNKLLYTDKLFTLAYEQSLNRSKKLGGRKGHNRGRSGDSSVEGGGDSIPSRYQLSMRPANRSAAVFHHAKYNETGFIPGWDYPPTMPNAFIPPVLMLLYLIPEMKNNVAVEAAAERSYFQTAKERSILPELGFLFHRIDSLSRNAMLSPGSTGSSSLARVGAWAPSNFISCLKAMPEAEQLQILDGSPAAVDVPRRPEAFYRFLLYQIDKETNKSLDPLGSMDFVSINEFISGSDPPSQSVTRVMTVDLSYESFLRGDSSETKPGVRFGDVLQRTLCKEIRLRAWSHGSKSYETIVQRKIATSLPSILSLSCACAGRKDEEGLTLWRGSADNGLWLPELIEVELSDTGSVTVREFVSNGDESGAGEWVESTSGHALPQSVSDIVAKASNKDGSCARRRRYRLEAVLSIVRDDYDRKSSELLDFVEGPFGHSVLHVRVNKNYKKHVLEEQIQELESYLNAAGGGGLSGLTLLGISDDKIMQNRLEKAKEKLRGLNESDEGDEWVMLNGYNVSNTIIEDARAFHNRFKEPSLVVFRSIDEEEEMSARSKSLRLARSSVPPEAMKTFSLTNGTKSRSAEWQRPSNLPGRGDLIAFDAEFVSVQEEESALTESGSKVVLREMRYAVGRISLIDCRTRTVIIDDHVLPREPVVDYLTRFSGIVAKDLDPKQSPHHLIGSRAAYLKLRYLMERGCIFVGHGLQQDFWTLNLAVPAHQIIDTVEIYHKPAQRYISLRFLTNFVLKRDMQQDVHDSVEDAMAAYELYAAALELKKKSKQSSGIGGDGSGSEFYKLLDALYEYGQKNDWKLGIDGD